MGMTRKYWKGIDELKETPQFIESRDQEFPSHVSVDEFLADDKVAESSTGRRDFLKFLGFSVAAATVAACEAPVVKAVPYVNKPENVTPGMATWYASTYYDGNSYASILVKTREGRPIFIKGNRDFGITNGATNPQIIASVLGLYDGARLKDNLVKGKSGAKPSDVDNTVINALSSSSSIALVSGSVISPSTQMAIQALNDSMGGKVKHIQYDAVSYAGMREANKLSFGEALIPNYDFSKAKTIVSIGADFLSTWLFSTKFASEYGTRRNPDGEWMSQHYQFESIMSVTGSNADGRAMVKPSEYAEVIKYLTDGSGKLSAEAKVIADKAKKALASSGKDSIVVCGSNNVALQVLTNNLNNKLGAYGNTIDLNDRINMYQSNDTEMNAFVSDVIAGKGPDAVIFMGSNPVYTLPNGAAFGKALKNVKHKIAISMHNDETASLCDVVIAQHHALESWMDFNPTTSHYALAQPMIRPLHNTSSEMESLLVWAGKAQRGGKNSKVAYDYIRETWAEKMGTPEPYTSESFWNLVVHNSCKSLDLQEPEVALTFNSSSMSAVTADKLPKGGKTEVVLYQKASMATGAMAGNPWLQEMPDPMTKVTWDNYITMNPTEMSGYATTFDQENGLTLATLKVGESTVKLPVYPLPGQALGTVGVALGYGRSAKPEDIGLAAYQTKEYGGTLSDENNKPVAVGQNAYPFASFANGAYAYETSGSLTNTNEMYLIGATQIHSTAMGRHSVVRETTLDIYKSKGKEAYNPAHMLGKLDENGHHVMAPVGEFDLWDAHPVEHIGHRWGMSIDLSSCIGCGTCLIACQSENNVPVVGKDEVRRGREMHWLRIDRYFASDVEAAPGSRKEHDMSKMEFFAAAEIAAKNPAVVHMPMMCHHCNHAPCETVCPVAATTHSNEGINQMAYNRCIGTRYCANNCPYKVRRFNWFNYPSYKKFTEINPSQDDLGRMVLNPDVTVRTRGVMEKCSFCIQRIQEGKLNAKAEQRPVMDGEVSSACADACPTNAIIIGDWNDKESMIRKSSSDKRAYQALEEVGVKPNVWFKVKVRNEVNAELAKLQKEEAHGHGGGHADDHGKKEGHAEEAHH